MNGSCGNSRTIRRTVLEKRLLAGLKERLMAPEVAAEAMRAYAEETNRLNRERRNAAASGRKELAGIEKTIKEIVTMIENAGYTPALIDRLRELEARQEDEASASIRGLIERITLLPGPKRGQIDAVLYEWTGTRDRKGRKNKTDTPVSGVSVSVVAGARTQDAFWAEWPNCK